MSEDLTLLSFLKKCNKNSWLCKKDDIINEIDPIILKDILIYYLTNKVKNKISQRSKQNILTILKKKNIYSISMDSQSNIFQFLSYKEISKNLKIISTEFKNISNKNSSISNICVSDIINKTTTMNDNEIKKFYKKLRMVQCIKIDEDIDEQYTQQIIESIKFTHLKRLLTNDYFSNEEVLKKFFHLNNQSIIPISEIYSPLTNISQIHSKQVHLKHLCINNIDGDTLFNIPNIESLCCLTITKNDITTKKLYKHLTHIKYLSIKIPINSYHWSIIKQIKTIQELHILCNIDNILDEIILPKLKVLCIEFIGNIYKFYHQHSYKVPIIAQNLQKVTLEIHESLTMQLLYNFHPQHVLKTSFFNIIKSTKCKYLNDLTVIFNDSFYEIVSVYFINLLQIFQIQNNNHINKQEFKLKVIFQNMEFGRFTVDEILKEKLNNIYTSTMMQLKRNSSFKLYINDETSQSDGTYWNSYVKFCNPFSYNYDYQIIKHLPDTCYCYTCNC